MNIFKVWKIYFRRENRVVDGLSKEEKSEKKYQTIIHVITFFLASVLTYELFYNLCNMVGAAVSGSPQQALVQGARMFPQMLLACALIHMFIWMVNTYRLWDTESVPKKWKFHGTVSMILGTIIFVYVIVGLIIGVYEKAVEGYPTMLFPLDCLFGGLLLIQFGWFARFHGKEIQKKIVKDIGNKSIKKQKNKVLKVLSLLVALFSFVAFFKGIFDMDFRHGAVLCNISVLGNYLSAFLMVFTYRFIYLEIKDEYKNAAQVVFSSAFFIINLLFFILYLVSVQKNPGALTYHANGVLPFDFTASVHVFFVGFLLNNLFGPLFALVKGILQRKKE